MARQTIPNEPTFTEYTVNVETSAFPISFALFSKDDLTVKVGGSALSQSAFLFAGTLLDGGGYAGGTVTLNTPVSGGVVVRIERNVVLERTSNYAPATSVPVAVMDQSLNRLTAQAQDSRREIDRAHTRLDALGSDSAEIALEAKVAAEAARDVAITKAAEADADAYTAATTAAEIPAAVDQALIDIAAAKAAATADVGTDLGTAQALLQDQVDAAILTVNTEATDGQAAIATDAAAAETDIDDASTAAVAAVAAAQTTATDAVSAAETAAEGAISDAQDAAQAAIATDRAAALSAIAADKLEAAASSTAAETSATAAATARTAAEAARDQLLALDGSGWAALITGAMPDPVSQALFAVQGAWSTQPSATVLNIYEDLLAAMIDDGTFDLVDVAWPLFGHSLQAQQVSLVRPTAAKQAVAYGTLVRTPYVGIKGDDSGAVLSAFGRSTLTTIYSTQNSNSLGVLVDQAPTILNGVMAFAGLSRVGLDVSDPTRVVSRATAGSSTALNVTSAMASNSFFVVDRSDANSAKLFKNGAAIGSATSYPSTGADTSFLLLNSTTTTASSRSNARLKFAFRGGHLSDAQQASLSAAVHTAAAKMAAFA